MKKLNLLPSEIKSQIEFSKKNLRLTRLIYGLFASVYVVVALFAVLIFFQYTQREEAKNQRRYAQAQIDEQELDYKKATDLYNRIKAITKIEKTDTDWDKVLTELAKQTPTGVQVTNLSLSANSGTRARISGNAASDTDVVAFKENLSHSNLFQYVDIEAISTGADTTNKNRSVKAFSISLNLNTKETLRNE